MKKDNVYICVCQAYINENIYRIIKQKLERYNVYIGLSNIFDINDTLKIYQSICGENKVYVEQSENDRLKLIQKIAPIELIYDEIDTYISRKSKVMEYSNILQKWNGKCIPIYELQGRSKIDDIIECNNDIFQESKNISLSMLLKSKKFLRVIESHSGLTCMLLKNLIFEGEDGESKEYDGFWVSSLCDSLLRGKADKEIVDVSDRIHTIEWMMDVTEKPLIVDLDSGGRIEQFADSVLKLARLGIDAIVIEDKVGAKTNSLYVGGKKQAQDDVEKFCEKIRVGKKYVKNRNTMIVSRIESLVLGKSVQDALFRADKYIQAGADAILIHNNTQDLTPIKKFCNEYNKFQNRVPLILIPSSYSYIYETELKNMGCNMVIYANHVTRSIIPIILDTAEKILIEGRALEASVDCISIEEVLKLGI